MTVLLYALVLASLTNPWAVCAQENSTEAPTNQQLRAGTVRVNPIDNQEYAWIPAGTFQMGCVLDDYYCEDDEYPHHEVTLTKGFWIGRSHVTVEAYLRLLGGHRTCPCRRLRNSMLNGARKTIRLCG